MAKAKTPKKESTTKKPSLVKRVVDKITKPKKAKAEIKAEIKAETPATTQSIEEKLHLLFHTTSTYVSSSVLKGIGLTDAELPDMGNRTKTFGSMSIFLQDNDLYRICK